MVTSKGPRLVMHLFDLNILLGVFFTSHPNHEQAVEAYKKYSKLGWATCPMTENGFVRVGLQNIFLEEVQNSQDLIKSLELWKKDGKHHFWTDDLSLTDDLITHIPDHRSITDLYLLALAVKKGGKLITLNHRIQAECVKGGEESLILIE